VTAEFAVAFLFAGSQVHSASVHASRDLCGRLHMRTRQAAQVLHCGDLWHRPQVRLSVGTGKPLKPPALLCVLCLATLWHLLNL